MEIRDGGLEIKCLAFHEVKAKKSDGKRVIASGKLVGKSPSFYTAIFGSYIRTLVFGFPVDLELASISKGLEYVINIVAHEYYMSSDPGSLC